MKFCPNSQRIMVYLRSNQKSGTMPTLLKTVIADFRNIVFQELEFSPKINCIWGDNGSGKTNLLDAIYYMSMTKSALGISDSFNFRHGTDAFTISGTYLMQSGLESRFSVGVKKGEEKKLRCDGKNCRIAEHIGRLPAVFVSPSDISLVSDSPEERRRFINSVVSQMDQEYMFRLQQYNRLLAQRNAFLRDGVGDMSLLAVIDAKMSTLAEGIYERRRDFCEPLAAAVNDCYHRLSNGRESVSVRYRSDLDGTDLETLLQKSIERDRIMKYTTVGVQRDDFLFSMDDYPIRRCGSQGQQKTFLLSLKMAQFELMRTSFGFPPLLLLDDVFDKLDFNRTSNLLKLVSGDDFGQIFITDSNKVRMEKLPSGVTGDRFFFETQNGCFSRTEDMR